MLALCAKAEFELGIGQEQSASTGDLRGTVVQVKAQPLELLGLLLTDRDHHFVKGHVLVVIAQCCLGSRGEQWLGQLRAVLQARWQAVAADLARGAVISQARSRQVAAHHALHRQHVQWLAHHRSAAHLRWHLDIQHMHGHHALELGEPPLAQRCQDLSLVRNRRGEHPVVCRNPIRGHEQQMSLRSLVQIAHLARIHMLVFSRQCVVGGRNVRHRMSPGV